MLRHLFWRSSNYFSKKKNKGDRTGQSSARKRAYTEWDSKPWSPVPKVCATSGRVATEANGKHEHFCSSCPCIYNINAYLWVNGKGM